MFSFYIAPVKLGDVVVAPHRSLSASGCNGKTTEVPGRNNIRGSSGFSATQYDFRDAHEPNRDSGAGPDVTIGSTCPSFNLVMEPTAR